MREVISIHVGQCGARIGEKFWENVAGEHGLDEEGFLRGKLDDEKVRLA